MTHCTDNASTTFYVHNGVATSYAEFNHLVCRRAQQMARWQGEVIALWLDNDPDYVINLFAAWKAGATPFLISRRLPPATVVALLEAANARALVTAPGDTAWPVPVLAPAGDRAAVPAEGCQPEAEIGSATQEVAFILHTSGTTGLPKLVPVTRDNLLASMALQLNHWKGCWKAGDATLGMLPLFHAFGLVSQLLCCYRLKGRYHFCGPNPHEILAQLEREGGHISHLFTVPWLLEQMVAEPSGLANLKTLRFIAVGGAPLGEDIGDRLTAAGVRVVQNYGMTEIGCAFMSSVSGGDWRDMIPVIPERFWHLEDGTGTLIVRADCPTLSASAGQDFVTHDILRRSPAGGYRHLGRRDDLVVHANGEKTSAVLVEQKILSRLRHTVDRAAFLGSGKLRPACILQLKQSPGPGDREAIFAALDRTNAELPGHSRIGRDMVLLLAPGEKRLPVTAKGTVQRKLAEAEFAEELSQLESGGSTRGGATVESFFDEPHRLDRRASLFEQGLDSLRAVSLAQHIARLVPHRHVPLNVVYRYPTLEQLGKFVKGDDALAERLPPLFPDFRPADVTAASCRDHRPPYHVLLTGSTGFIGTELVEALLERPSVESVSCLVRQVPPHAHANRKVRYYGGYRLGDRHLGLSRADYEELAERVDTVIHAAWPIRFNDTYGQLADSTLGSVRHLIEFSRRNDKALNFLSSIATVMLHPGKKAVDEEWPAPTAAACLPHGYAQTKWEAEQVILRSGVRPKIFRLGQISAHRKTLKWNAKEHIPIILAASAGLGSVPVMPLPVDWVPVDVACRAVVELLSVSGVNVHHITNPRPRAAECLAAGIKPLPLARWMAEAEPQLDRYPALRSIWPFLAEVRRLFDRIRPLDAAATCRHSRTLAGCKAISDDYIREIRHRAVRDAE
jgi:acyl-CoA synthetase (AMP-forming)/AMP-acid ligase II/nucleoside-diphosphate-sugar epimerase